MLQGLSLVKILVDLLIAGIAVYGVYLFLGMLNLPQPLRTIVLLIVAVIALIFLANLFGIGI